VYGASVQQKASPVRRFSRWLHHPAISPAQWYKPVLQAALVDWPAKTRLCVALDTTALTPFVLIRASLLYRGRAIPLAWRAMRHRSTQVSFEAYQPVLNQVCAIMPAGQVITLLADRGFVHEQLLHYLRKQQWHFRLRLPADTLVHLSAQHVSAVRDLCPPAGRNRFFHGVSILGAAFGPVSPALAALIFGWILHRTHSQLSPHVEPSSERERALTTRLLCKLSVFKLPYMCQPIRRQYSKPESRSCRHRAFSARQARMKETYR
jgi:hypothetical protein